MWEPKDDDGAPDVHHPEPVAPTQIAGRRTHLSPSVPLPTPMRPPMSVPAPPPTFAPPTPPAIPAPKLAVDGQLPIGHARYENLSGTAGTGKTYNIKRLIEQSPYGSVLLAATTGIAAVNLGEGTTINAALKYFDTDSLKQSFLNGTLAATLRRLRRAGVRRLVIDEKSMMWGEQLTYIVRANEEIDRMQQADDAFDEARGGDDDEYAYEKAGFRAQDTSNKEPLAITLVGDFGQLPPIPPDGPNGRKLQTLFAFDSPEWMPKFAGNTTQLTKIWRQDAQDFIQALQAIRAGNPVRALEFFTSDRFSSDVDDRFDGTTIFAKNIEVDRFNALRLDQLNTPSMTAVTVVKGKPRGDWNNIPARLTLKEGALVMILANRREYEDEEDNKGRIVYANGDLGTLLGAEDDNTWLVLLHRNGETVKVCAVHRDNTVPLEPGRKKELKAQYGDFGWQQYVTEDGRQEIIGGIDYMPMRAAYGCTVHKTQGLTLDRVQVNTRDPFFRHPGMLFVALSRCRTAEGLRVIGNQRGFIERCKIEPRVQPWL